MADKHYSMDNPDPQRHRPLTFDWHWSGAGAVEEGTSEQLVTLSAGEWERLREEARGTRTAARIGRLDTARGTLQRCAECGAEAVRRYRVSEDGTLRAGYCMSCWRALTGPYEPRGAEAPQPTDRNGRPAATAAETLALLERHTGPIAGAVRGGDGRDRYLLIRKEDAMTVLRMQAATSASPWNVRRTKGAAVVLEPAALGRRNRTTP